MLVRFVCLCITLEINIVLMLRGIYTSLNLSSVMLGTIHFLINKMDESVDVFDRNLCRDDVKLLSALLTETEKQ